MKYKDPLTVLQYMGGSLPVHICMSVFAGYVYYSDANDFPCKDPNTQKEVLDYFNDIKYMFYVHIIYSVLYAICRSLHTMHFYGAYFKPFFTITGITFYMGGYIWVSYQYMLAH